jgi:hypothetical protein
MIEDGHEHTPLWSIGIMNRPIDTLLDRPPDMIRPLAHVNGWHLCDPFGVYLGDRLTIMAEMVTPGYEDIGELVSVEPSVDNSVVTPHRLRLVDHHISYPFLFRWRDAIYMVPETYKANQVSLYRAVRFPTEWEHVKVLLPKVAGVDMTLFTHEDRWWMIGTGKSKDWPGSQSHLYGWYAPTPLGPWTPHNKRPMRQGTHLVRPAGSTFRRDGQLYRMVQDSNTFYGHQVMIYRVNKLTPDEFEEEHVLTIEPIKDSIFSHGIHHISSVDGTTTLIGGSA